MNLKDMNLMALREFIESRNDAKDNGSAWWFMQMLHTKI